MLRVEVIIPKQLVFDPKRMLKTVDNALDQAAAGCKADFNTTTSTWNHRPTFLVRKGAGERTIYTSDVIYNYVSEGTRPHIIRPRQAKRLHFFRTGFRPKSRYRYIGSNQGAVANQDETFTQLVHHPGTAAREFEKVIAEKWEKELPIELQRAIDAEVGK